ncbi:hypothetical protein MLD38_012971 [Melastoma candidum]|uniref:Uncharacterized protein n=1 Tax=Melastoma candidum TaxID=119954 RepID=A0ACB9R7P4_9MYRT|nr:hypothetical protein MLD38_012971 [Melastoma candidum]
MNPSLPDPDSLSRLASFPLDPTLTLTPRVRLNLSIFPDAGSGVKPVDHWQIKRALLDYLKAASRSLGSASLQISGAGDPKKRRRGDAVARGVLVVRDLGSVKEEDYETWKEKELRGRLDGIELVLEGTRFRVSVEVPAADSFEDLRKEWLEYYAFKYKDRGRGAREEPDAIVIRGLPSRWFAETRVSSKPSMLVTHTIFSTLGSLRNIHVAEDDDFGQEVGDDTAGLVSGLHCKVVVQFEKQRDFHNALKALCGRSLEKEGTQLIADYEVSWDKDNFFRYSRSHLQENGSGRTSSVHLGEIRRDVHKSRSRRSPEQARPKRFRE